MRTEYDFGGIATDDLKIGRREICSGGGVIWQTSGPYYIRIAVVYQRS